MSIDGIHTAVRQAIVMLEAAQGNLGNALAAADEGVRRIAVGIDGTGRPGFDDILAGVQQTLASCAAAKEQLSAACATAQAYEDRT